ncbi:LytTR family transcriptional regulator DNA-binding domain-containing protein [Polaribacter porphyrae]|uniref:HTH LytTR-type domain-containing protein n=1 Tax=Polaribacter porphyrae TaxID=1137780 RepID=A0A2S7WRD6_9FLAO|nr:LytTR family transcriptional regulator DNA-binding domain-containing protein [Polaribacter porphyrae]PQJ79871.1 hypothetical protein BTO18_12105 [Polaribacter porphyrae]
MFKLKEYKTRFLFRFGKSLIPIKIENIAYFFRDEIVFARTIDGNSYPLDESLNELQKQINPNDFVRVNRQLLLNADSISKLTPYKPGQLEIQLIPEFHKPIYLSHERSKCLREFLNE